MPASIVARSATAFTIQVGISYASSMLDFEEAIQRGLNEAGTLATTEALQQFDADGSPITAGDTKLTSKGKLTKEYQTPYGVAPVERHVYQSSRGGKTYCPLDRNARIVVSSTPKFAKMVSHKYAEFGSASVWPSGSLDGDLMVLTPLPTRHRSGHAAPGSASGGHGGGSATAGCTPA